MNGDRPHPLSGVAAAGGPRSGYPRGGPPRPRREAYDEVAYRDALRTLGLFAPVAIDDIQHAYRSRAKRMHPDRFSGNGAGNGEAEQATLRIQKLNLAHEYVVRHFRAFDKVQRRAWRRGDAPPRVWQEILLAPVTLVYSMALLAAALPGAVLRLLRLNRVWRAWLALGPHLVIVAAFIALESWRLGPPWIRWWIGIALLVMLAADLASRVTRESNPLRGHRAFGRLQALVSGS